MKDKLSAMLDGDLDDHSCAPVLDRIERDPELKAQWETYCLIGDVLRGEPRHGGGLTARVMANIESEPTVLAPSPRRQAPENDALSRVLMPIAASVMGILAVGWVAHTLYSQPQDGVSFAGAAAPIQAVEASLAQVRLVAAERLDPHREYVFLHQAMNAGGPIPRVIHHVRTVTDTLGDVPR